MHLLCTIWHKQFSKHMVNMQHHLQLLCYVYLSGISENQARDSAKKISEKSSRVQPFQ